MSWLWARLHKRSQRLIYFAGGFQAFADHLTAAVRAQGAEVRLATPVSAIRRTTRVWRCTAGGETVFDRVVVTTGPHLLARLAPELPPSTWRRWALPYLGAIVAVVALDRPLMERVYWLNMDKREFPFLACVEHTNFVDAAHYGGQRLVYVGDYLAPDHRAFGLTDEELLDEWLPSLAAVNPAFDRSWVQQILGPPRQLRPARGLAGLLGPHPGHPDARCPACTWPP